MADSKQKSPVKNTPLGAVPKVSTAIPGKLDPATAPTGASLDDLETRLHAGGMDEDIATVIAHNWRKAVGAAVVVVIGVWLFETYRAMQRTKLGEAAEQFSTMQSEFAKALASNAFAPGAGAEGESIRGALDSQLQVLKSEVSGTSYGKFAELYRAQSALQRGDFEAARKALVSYDVVRFRDFSAPVSTSELNRSDIFSELATMLAARTMIAEQATKDSATPSPEAAQLLKGLVYGGRFLSLEALVALARYSSVVTLPPESEAKAVATNYLAARPQLSELVYAELEKIGLILRQKPEGVELEVG